jgi:hypothetical protein
MHAQKQKRRVCISCRLAKCLAAGMKPQLFRKETQKTQDCNSETKVNNTQIAQYQPVMVCKKKLSFKTEFTVKYL